jgi:hypothetical protein
MNPIYRPPLNMLYLAAEDLNQKEDYIHEISDTFRF